MMLDPVGGGGGVCPACRFSPCMCPEAPPPEDTLTENDPPVPPSSAVEAPLGPEGAALAVLLGTVIRDALGPVLTRLDGIEAALVRAGLVAAE